MNQTVKPTMGDAPSPAEMYQNFFVPAIFNPWTEVLLDHADPQPGEFVLDVACGTGVVARSAAEQTGPNGKTAGVDISADMLRVARRLADRDALSIEWQECDASSLPFDDGTFDLCLCQQGLQFFPDRIGALSEMHRVLRDGGRAAIKTWKSLDHHPLYRALLGAEARYLDIPLEEAALPFTLGDRDTIRQWLGQAGFGRVEIREASQEVEFREADRFVALTTLAAAAVLPELALDDPEDRNQLIETVAEEARDEIEKYRKGDRISFTMHAHIAIAFA